MQPRKPSQRIIAFFGTSNFIFSSCSKIILVAAETINAQTLNYQVLFQLIRKQFYTYKDKA